MKRRSVETKRNGLMDFLRRNLPGTSVEKQFWMPDATAIQCYDCGLPFTTFRRKHHCRICGQIFCTECCNETIDAKLLKRSTTERLLRVCKYCYKEVIRSVLPNQTTESVPTTPTTVSYSKRFFHSMIGRRLSSSSVSDIVRSTHLSATETDSRNNCDKEECAPGSPNTRPFSSASIHCDQTFSPSFDRRESLNTTPTFDALRDLMAKMDETMDASEPNWVKEIQESKQTNNESDDAIGDDFVQVATESDGFEKIIGPKRYFFLGNEDDEDDDDLFGSKSENIQVYKLPFSSNETVVRYSPSASVKPDEMATESATEVSSSSESSQSLPRQLSMASFYKNLLSNGKFLFENEDEEVDGFRSATTNIEQPKQLSDLSLDSRPLLFDAIYDRHTNRLLQEILIEEGLSLDWLTVLNDIAKKIANTVTLNHHAYMYSVDNYYQLYSEAPETKTYPMDIRQRVKIKSIPCGSKLDCSIVNGVVFNKNVANRNMRTSIDNPQILLFACSIGYDERRRSLTSNSTTSVKLTMFDSMRLQESNYILNLVAKIESLKPDVIFVQGSVSQTALELLLDKKITVILNVKLSLLERIALFTGTYLIYSPETILNTTRVGKCGKFRIQEFVISESSSRLPNELARGSVAKKSLMFLEGCSESTGCTVLLRGSLLFEEFRKVKNILKYMVYVHYNSRLEKTFHQIVNCLPIEEGEWSSPNELFQFVIRGRQRILSAKSVRSADGDAATEESKPLKPRLTSVVDNSDPLRAFKDEQEPKTVPTLVDSVSEKLQQILPKLILSCSPCITFPVTFLMSANIYQRSSLRFYFSNQLLQSNRLAEETETPPKCADSHRKDGDFVNFLYLLASQNATDTELNSLMPSEWPKLATLRNTLGMRYMVTKSHPLLLNNDYDFKKQSQQFLADFRASGPNVSVRPELFTRSETKSNSKPAPIVDPLSNQAQQSISVQFSLFSPQSENVPNYCFKPKIIDIHYYGKNDMSLGAFLFRHFFFRVTRFNQTQETAAAAVEPEAYMASMANSTMSRKIICPNENCSVSMFRHVMRFTHHKGTVTVLLNKIQDSGQVNMPHQILTWSFCLHCKHKSSYAQMSLDALALSFGKFLELKFYANRHYDYNRYFKEQNSCRHLFHKECYQFFSYDQLIVIFKFDSIVVREIVTPAPIIPITRNHFSKIDLVNHLKELTIQCNDTFQRIVNTIETIQLSTGNKNLTTSTALANLTLEQADQQILEDFLLKLKKEEEDFAASVKEIHLRISTPEAGEFDVVELFRIHNSVSRMKKLIAERVCTWNEKINEFVLSRRRNPDKLTSFMTRLLPTDSLFSNSSDSKTETNKDETEDGRELDCVNHNDSGYSNGSDETEGVQSPPNKLTNLTSKVISKVTTKTADSENLTTSTSSFASRFLPKTTEENFVNIELPFDNGKSTQMLEHYQLPTYKDIAIIVRNKDPGSIIAYAMTTPEYEQKLTEIRNRLKELKNDGANDSVLSSPPKVENVDGNVISKRDDSFHQIDIQFSDSFGKFYCCIFHAEQFQQFRSFVLKDGGNSNRISVRNTYQYPKTSPFSEDLYIHSLANCNPWNALGGKSGSTFSKTHNQRFILKEVTKGEMKHFLSFVTDYIEYCKRPYIDKYASALVKVVGVYKISYKDILTNKGSVHYILVMENLFYECNITFIYDLKGSMRNRKVDIDIRTIQEDGNADISDDPPVSNQSANMVRNRSNEQVSTVLLDENLRQMCTTVPLYVYEHSKKLLMAAIDRDSTFLCEKSVMDYSLLVGFDDEHSEFVVGIIDYVRLFNWEKVIEFRVKKIGNTVDPTIVNPATYQRRFLDAINEYFLVVPDKWHPFIDYSPLFTDNEADQSGTDLVV